MDRTVLRSPVILTRLLDGKGTVVDMLADAGSSAYGDASNEAPHDSLGLVSRLSHPSLEATDQCLVGLWRGA